MKRRPLLRVIAAFALGFSMLVLGLPTSGQTHRPPEESLALVRKIAEVLSDAPVLSGRFEQEKSIAGFKKPLISSGTFSVEREHGIVWHTVSPFESRLIISRARIAEQHSDGELRTLIDDKAKPILETINEILFAVMTADLDLIAKQFEISGQMTSTNQWELALTPRNPAVRKWLDRVELWGDTYVQKVSLEESHGDRSTIYLTDHRSEKRDS